MKILLIKLGALGDVLRTTPLLTALKQKHPDCHITWVVDAAHRDVLEHNALIDALLDYSEETVLALKKKTFDIAVNLDKETEATGLLAVTNASKKMGFSQDGLGRLCAADPLSDYAYRLGMDDELKFQKNKKSYQQISFEQLGMRFHGEEYVFSVDEASDAQAADYLKKIGIKTENLPRPVIGLNTGSGARFAGKKLPMESYVKLAEKFHRELNACIFLLGGPDEQDRNLLIQRKAACPVVNTGSHPIRRFAALVKTCDLVVTGDTTALHIAVAVKTRVLVYFASTCAQEIELYGRGRKIASDISCAPCYKKICPIDEQCMKDMSIEQIFNEAKILLGEHATRLS